MKSVIFLITVLLFTACGSKKKVNVSDKTFEVEKVAKFYATFLKDKGKKFDFGTTVTSTGKTPAVIFKKDITCGKGEKVGKVVKIGKMGKFGKMTYTIENYPDENNPKTSRLAILSAIETLKKYCSNDIQIGT